MLDVTLQLPRCRLWSEDHLHQRTLMDWVRIPGEKVAATLTLREKFNSLRLSHEVARSTARLYLTRLDEKAYGMRGRRGKERLFRVVIQEGSATGFGTRLHLHLMMQVPSGWAFDEWVRTCCAEWCKLDWSARENCFDRVTSDRWKEYLFKLKSEYQLLDSALFELWYLPVR